MLRASLITLIIFSLATPPILCAGNSLEALEKVVAARGQVQPGLQSYLATVASSRIKEVMASLTGSMPSDVIPPPTPVIKKLWQRNGKGLVFASQAQLPPPAETVIKQLFDNLAIEFDEMLLPAGKTEQRCNLVKDAEVKSSEVALSDTLIYHLDLIFAKPTDLNEAFYSRGLRLPQEQINSLAFDVDTRTNTISEMDIVANDGLRLTVEIRYRAVAGGYLPERFQVTSPDGKIDDLLEIKFSEVDSYLLPASMLRVIRHPGLQEKLEVFFKEYQVNQPIPEDIQPRLDNL
jgi:hypothetical protein